MPQGATGSSLFVEIRNPPKPVEGPPVVLLHGWASTSAYWEPLVDKLLDAGHTVWIVDLPGYHPGESLPENFDWTLDSVAAAVAEEISSRQEPGLPAAGAVHVVGHSLGGSVALTLAARHPECVATLTLVGMVPAPPNEGFRSMLSSQLRQGFIDAGAQEKLMKAWFGPLEAAEREILGRGFSVPFGVLGASGEAGLQGVDSRDPALVTAPTLVIIGTDDTLRTPAQVQEFVAGSPQRRLAAIPNAGHSVHWEQPAACAKAMEKFWQETRPTAKPAPPRRKMSDI